MNSESQYPTKGLYAITPDNLLESKNRIRQIEAALKGGASVVQFRQKRKKKKGALLEFALEIKAICKEFDASFIVNDNIELTLEIDADGIHLGKEDLSYERTRALLGPDKFIGISCYYSVKRAIAAEKAGANYVAFGSFYRSVTKKHAPLCSVKTLRKASLEIDIPIVAIGGISAGNGATLIENGADLLACISSVFKNGDPSKSARIFNMLFEKVTDK